MKFDPYEILGVDRDATEKQIHDAYRKKARTAHPDVDGGDKEVFQKLARAYEILGDPDARKRFDAGEDPDAAPSQLPDELDLIFPFISPAFMQDEIEPIEYIRQQLDNARAPFRSKIRVVTKRKIRLECRLKKLGRKDGKEANEIALQFLTVNLEAGIESLRAEMAKVKTAIDAYTAAIKFLDGIECPIGQSAHHDRRSGPHDLWAMYFPAGPLGE